MKRKYLIKRMLATTCVATMMLAGCGNSGEGRTANVEAPEYELSVEEKDIENGYMNFSIELFKQSMNEDGNTLISPISVIYALDMLSAGCEGETKDELIEMLCPGVTSEDLLAYAREYKDRFDGKSKFYLANSVWANEDMIKDALNPEYVATLEEYVDAEATMVPFNNETLDMINAWTKDKTDGMIPEIVDYIPDNAALYLVNAMAFDGKWDKPYDEYHIDENGTFINADGQEETARMLSSKEDWYIESKDATGFIKYYAGKDFAFVAILPNDESVSIEDFVSEFSGEDFSKMLKTKTDLYEVYTSIPCFEAEYSITLNDAFKELGMERAFDEDLAEFKTMADLGPGHNIFVNRVLHKTYIELNEEGTKAGAATAIEMTDKMALMEDEERYVYLDRPFVYAIIDLETKLPIMMGTINTLK